MLNDKRLPARRTSMTRGVIAFGNCSDDGLAELVRGRRPSGLTVPEEPWSLAGALAAGNVTDERTHTEALDAALRGADVIVEVEPSQFDAFLEDVDRLGIEVWQPAADEPAPVDWAPLLDALAAGATTKEAARRCHLSLRSAHRRLAVARRVLGVSTTAAAVARWSGAEPHPG
jgi:hypothetical protein